MCADLENAADERKAAGCGVPHVVIESGEGVRVSHDGVLISFVFFIV
jgi:hypothetical protein